MGFFERFIKKKNQASAAVNGFSAGMVVGYSPSFSNFDGEIYESIQVRRAIDARATHNSKLKFHFTGIESLNIEQKRIQLRPNPWQTWSQFIYRVSTILDISSSAFILPLLSDDSERTVGFFTALPEKCMIVRSRDNNLWIKYTFQDNTTGYIEMERAGIITRFQYKDEFAGTENTALNETMNLVSLQSQGIEESIKNGATYRFMAQVNNFMSDEDLTKERKRFNEKAFAGDGGGLLLFPNTYKDIEQLKNDAFVVDSDQMKIINDNINKYFGVSENILNNSAIGDELNAFYEGVVEPFAIRLTELFNKILFTEQELMAGSSVILSSNRLQYMSNKDKKAFTESMMDRGMLLIDEAREIWNLPPLPNSLGQMYTLRGEYYLIDMKGNIVKKADSNVAKKGETNGRTEDEETE